jgi:hypothetical protein
MLRSYIIFASEDLIPLRISIHERPSQGYADQESPVGPTPGHQWAAKLSDRDRRDLELRNQLPLEEIFDPFLEKSGAIFGAVLFALTPVAILVTNAAHVGYGVSIITVPAAFMMLCRDLIYDWRNRERKPVNGDTKGRDSDVEQGHGRATAAQLPNDSLPAERGVSEKRESDEDQPQSPTYPPPVIQPPQSGLKSLDSTFALPVDHAEMILPSRSVNGSNRTLEEFPRTDSPARVDEELELVYYDTRWTFYGLCEHIVVLWGQLPFPTVKTVLLHLPFSLVPFAFCMFIIVEGLVTKGWVEILAKGWAIWVSKGNLASTIAGMGFVSVILCNASHFLFSSSVF